MSHRYINVLVSSISKKIPLVKVIKSAAEKMSVKGKVIGADADSECIGKYFVDQFWEMPHLSEISPEEFISYCQFYKVNRVIPTRDGELLFYAAHKQQFFQQGIHVMVSDKEAIESCLDKCEFYQTLSRLGFPSVETSTFIEKLECESYVVKERYGAGSQMIGINLSKKEATSYAKQLNSPVFQPYIKGEELSVDLYLDQSGKTKGVIVRQRNLVVGGESQVTTTIQNEVVEKMCSKMAEELNLYGHVMFQLIHSEANDVYYVLECNPRFGGASTLSLKVGLDSFYWFFLETAGEDLTKYPYQRSEVEKRLIRHPEDLILSCPTHV